MRKKWEYKVVMVKEPVSDEHLKVLDELGKESWELVEVVPIGKGGFGETSSTRFYFKREIK